MTRALLAAALTALAPAALAQGSADATAPPMEEAQGQSAPAPAQAGEPGQQVAATPPASAPVAAAPQAPARNPAPPPPPPDDEERARAERALERTLIERGGLLLPPGQFELVPEIAYELADAPVLRDDGTAMPGELRVFTGTTTLRLGLPLRLQVEGEVPFVFAQHAPAAGAEASDAALGDVRVGGTIHLVRAGGRVPDVLVGGFYKARTGRSTLDDPPASVPSGNGVEQFGGSLSLVKALDPVVLLISGEVTESVPRELEAGWLDLRAAVGITTSAILAVSPDTSLVFGLEQKYSQYARLAGQGVPGTNRSDATLLLGLATTISRSGLLEARVGVGLTEGVPRISLGLSLPLQF
jgi:hypothetical protein